MSHKKRSVGEEMNDVRWTYVCWWWMIINLPNPQLNYRKSKYSATSYKSIFGTITSSIVHFFFVVTQIDFIHLLRLQKHSFDFRAHCSRFTWFYWCIVSFSNIDKINKFLCTLWLSVLCDKINVWFCYNARITKSNWRKRRLSLFCGASGSSLLTADSCCRCQ